MRLGNFPDAWDFYSLHIMKKQIIVAAVLSTLLSGASFAQQAKEGPWMVRARAVYLDSTDVSAGGVNQGTFKIDPVLAGVGLGWRF